MSLRRYVDMRIDLLQEEIDRRFVSELRALEMATAAMDHRLAGMNEFRAQLADTISRYETREVAETHRKDVRERLDKVEAELARARGRVSAYAAIVGVAGVLLAVLGFALQHLTR